MRWRGGWEGSERCIAGTPKGRHPSQPDPWSSFPVMASLPLKNSQNPFSQVMVPDVQKLINQSGNVSVDIFNTRLVKPPTSVLVFPIKVRRRQPPLAVTSHHGRLAMHACADEPPMRPLHPLPQVKSHTFGAVFCMSGVQTDFADTAPRMREMCEVMSPHLLQALLAGKLAGDYEVQCLVPRPSL